MTREEFNSETGYSISETDWAEVSAVLSMVSLDSARAGGVPLAFGIARDVCKRYKTTEDLWLYKNEYVEKLEDAVFSRDEDKLFEVMYKYHMDKWVVERKMRHGFRFTEAEIKSVVSALKK